MNALQLALTGLAAAGTLSLATIAPAYADGAASTRNIIIGAAAVAGIAIESNLANKRAEARYNDDAYGDNGNYYGANGGRDAEQTNERQRDRDNHWQSGDNRGQNSGDYRRQNARGDQLQNGRQGDRGDGHRDDGNR